MVFWSESGWKPTRAAGILNFLLAGNPEMSYADVLAWAAANGLPDWVPSTDPTDQEQSAYLVALNGKIQWDEDYPYPANWSQLFKDWQAGYVAAEVPQPPTNSNVLTSQIASTAAAVAAVAPAPVPEIVIEPAPPAPAPIAIPQAPEPLSLVAQPQVNPAQPTAPSPIDFATPPQVQPALVAPQTAQTLPAIQPAAIEVLPAIAPPGAMQSGDGALIKIAIGLLLI